MGIAGTVIWQLIALALWTVIPVCVILYFLKRNGKVKALEQRVQSLELDRKK